MSGEILDEEKLRRGSGDAISRDDIAAPGNHEARKARSFGCRTAWHDGVQFLMSRIKDCGIGIDGRKIKHAPRQRQQALDERRHRVIVADRAEDTAIAIQEGGKGWSRNRVRRVKRCGAVDLADASALMWTRRAVDILIARRCENL